MVVFPKGSGRTPSGGGPFKGESEVVTSIGRAQSNKEVSATLHLVDGMVKIHVTSILSALGVADRTQSVLVAMKRDLLQLD